MGLEGHQQRCILRKYPEQHKCENPSRSINHPKDFMFYCGPANSFEVTDSRIDANLAAFDRGNPVNTFDATDLPYCALDSISGHRPVYMDIEANPDRMDVATDV